jgi:TolB-like protein
MKKSIFVLAALVLCAEAAFGQDNGIETLDRAINGSMSYLAGRLTPGTKVAVLNFAATRSASNYVIEELIAYLVNDGNLTVVDRSNLEMLQREMNFQLSGEVSDESAQAIGKKLGAQTIISGSLTPFGNMWRMRIKALEVETARVQGVRTYTIKKDAVLSNLIPKTIGDTIGTGALNIVFGLGSYLDGDVSGGITLSAGYAAAITLFIIEAAALDWDSPAVGVPATIGVTVASLTFAYGFARPFIYNRSSQLVTMLDRFHVDVVPAASNIDTFDTIHNRLGIHLAYSFTF